jgi:hypothetical protein
MFYQFRSILTFLVASLVLVTSSSIAQASDYDAELLRLTNTERKNAGLPALTISTQLSQAAQSHAEEMARNNYVSNTGLNGSTLSDRVKATGYSSSYIGTNIAAGYATPEQTIQQWMNGQGQEAILNSNYTEIGFGYAYSSSSEYKYYWVQVFGKPYNSNTTGNTTDNATENTTSNTASTNTASTSVKNLANCLFDSIETKYKEYFSPTVATEEWEPEPGKFAFVRIYTSSPYQSGLSLYEGGVAYALYEQWQYFSKFNYANTLFSGGNCILETQYSLITDPTIDLALVAKAGDETLGIFGERDSNGRLNTIKGLTFGSLSDETKNFTIELDSSYFPKKVIFPDNSSVEFINYNDSGATLRYHLPNGTVVNSITVALPIDRIKNAAAAIKKYTESPQPTKDNPVPSLNSTESTDCLKVMTEFHKLASNLLWGAFQLSSIASCGIASAEAILTGGWALPIAVWACSSVILDGIDHLADALTDGHSPFTRLNEDNGFWSGVASCAMRDVAGCTNAIAARFSKGVLEAFEPKTICKKAEKETKEETPNDTYNPSDCSLASGQSAVFDVTCDNCTELSMVSGNIATMKIEWVAPDKTPLYEIEVDGGTFLPVWGQSFRIPNELSCKGKLTLLIRADSVFSDPGEFNSICFTLPEPSSLQISANRVDIATGIKVLVYDWDEIGSFLKTIPVNIEGNNPKADTMCQERIVGYSWQK